MVVPPNRRWFQFSTRGLLLLLTALCGSFGYATESARRQRDAVAMLAPVAAIGYDDGSILSGRHREIKRRTGVLGFLEKCLGKDYFDRVSTVWPFRDKTIEPKHLKAITELSSVQELLLMDNELVDDAFVAQLVALRRLRRLRLNYTSVTDASLQYVARCPRIELLDIGDTYVDGSGFRFLQTSPSVSHLVLSKTEVTDKYLDDLGGCGHLRYIDLRNTRVTAAGVARLQKALPNCEIRWRD